MATGTACAEIGGGRFAYVETLGRADGAGDEIVVCVSNEGRRCYVELARWQTLATAAKTDAAGAASEGTSAPVSPSVVPSPPNTPSARTPTSSSLAVTLPTHALVTSQSPSANKLALYRSLFCGREDAYALGYLKKKTGRIGYSPVCATKWKQPACRFPKVRCSACRNRVLSPLTNEALRAHFKGLRDDFGDVVGIYPLLPDSTVRFLAADFDKGDWEAEARAYIRACGDLGASAYLERSRSGNGGHAWMFFDAPVPARAARAFGARAISLAMERYRALPFDAYDRFFPNQDVLPEGGLGNLIALPLQGRAYAQGNSVFIDEEGRPFPDQWRFLSGVRRTPAAIIEAAAPAKAADALGPLASNPRTDAPWEAPERPTLPAFPHEPVRVVSANMLYVDKEGLDAATVNAVRRLAAFANPAYYQAVAMHHSLNGVPRVIYAGEDSERYVGLPRGCEETLRRLLEEGGAELALEDRRERGRTIRVTFRGKLRPEQQEAVEALLAHDNGVLEAATGFGKTVIGAYLIARQRVSTLVIVPSTTLLEQWRTRLGEFLEINEELPELLTPTGRKSRKKRELIGQIGDGKDMPGGIVDVACAQSLFEDGDVAGERRVRGLVRSYGMVICDECHHVPSSRYEQVVRAACARWVYGLTATAMRKDRLDPIIFMQCGPIRHSFGGREQARLQSFARVLVPRFTRLRVPDDAGDGRGLGFNALVDLACEDADRNEMIVADAARLVGEGRVPLVLTRRVGHARALHEELVRLGVDTALLVGSGGAASRRAGLDELRARPFDARFAVVGTGSYLGEGFDDSRFDALLLAAPVAWKGLVAQYAGRIHREREGKGEALVYDYVDAHVPMFDGMYRARLREYAALGYELRMTGEDVPRARLYDDVGCRAAFLEDVAAAEHSVVVRGPFLHPRQATLLAEVFSAAHARGVTVSVEVEALRPDSTHGAAREKALRRLRDAGAGVREVEGRQPCLAVVDERVVWYGEVNLLSLTRRADVASAQSMRFESVAVAAELLGNDRPPGRSSAL